MNTQTPRWTPAQKAGFRRRPVTFPHALGGSGLFEDGALIRLLDRHPADLYDINLFDFDEAGGHRLRTGERGSRGGAELLDSIKQGRIWIQLRAVDKHDQAIGAAVRGAFAAIDELSGGFRPASLNAALILSAPGAKVPMHADAPGVVLFHLRGCKRLWIYPSDEAHLPSVAMEDIVLRQTTEDLPYRRSMDAAATVFDLEPGTAAAWPLHAPHRIENLEGFNVSLTVDYADWCARRTNGAYHAAGLMRRLGWTPPRVRDTPAVGQTAMWAASLALKRLAPVKSRIAGLKREFELGAHEAAGI